MPLIVLTVFLLVLFAAVPVPSGANYCVCNTAQSDSVLQKNIDYACGNGADCAAIQPNGACYNPNSVKDHCNYAVNSYFQKKGQTPDSCNFQGTATVSPNPPTGTGSGGCVLQSSPSPGGTTPTTPNTGGMTTPPASPTIGGTPGTPSTGGAMAPPTNPAGGTPNTGGMTSPSTSPGTPATGGTSTPGVFPGTTTSPGGIGFGPSGSPFGSTDNSPGVKLSTMTLALSVVATLVAYDFIHPRM